MADETDTGHADWLTDLAGGGLAGQELLEALRARLGAGEEAERAAREVETARRVRSLLLSLRAAEVSLPEGFEARLLERVRADQTLLDLLELYLEGFGVALVELINALFSLLPAAPQSRPATG